MAFFALAATVASSAFSVYGAAQSAKASREAAKQRAIANRRMMKNIRTEAQGRKLRNLDQLDRSNSAMVASTGARGITADSASALAVQRANASKFHLDNATIDLDVEQRIANLWSDSGAAYRQAQRASQQAGISALSSAAEGFAGIHGAVKAWNMKKQTQSLVGDINSGSAPEGGSTVQGMF